MDYNFIELSKKYLDEGLKDLDGLLRFKSVLDEYNPNSDAPFGVECKKALEYMLSLAESDGFKILNSDNYAGHIEFGEGEEILGLLGHLDVVPTDGVWSNDPFTPTLKDGRLYARGSVDDKGPVIATYIAMKALKDMGFKPKKRVRLIVGCDEESGSRCLKHYFEKNEMPQMGFSPDADYPLIYGEKAFNSFSIKGTLNDSIIKSWKSGTRANIVPDTTEVVLDKDYSNEFEAFLKKNNYKGKCEDGKLYTYGVASHGSLPELGVNANFIMAEFINEIHKDNFTSFITDIMSWDYDGKKMGIDITNGDMGHLSINPGVFSVHDGKVLIIVDCRVPSNDHGQNIDRIMTAHAKKYGLEYEASKKVPMHYVDPNSFLVKTLANVYEDISGDSKNKPMTIGGGTYAKFIPNCVAFGPVFPGEEDVIHRPDEYMIVESFRKNIAIYMKAIYELVK